MRNYPAPTGRLIKRVLAAVAAAALLTAPAAAQQPQPLDELTLIGPASLPLSLSLARVVDAGGLSDVAQKVSFSTWTNPDQLRASLISGQAPLAAAPSYAAANLYNRGLDIKLLNVVAWGIIYVVGPGDGPISWQELRGSTVAVPFKGDMPDLVFRYLAEQNGLNPDTDLDLQYMAAPTEAVAKVVTGGADYAVLPEQTASVAVAKGGQPGAPFAKVIDLQVEWGKATGGQPRIPQAGIVVSGQFYRQNPEVIAAVQRELAAAVAWVNENPEAAGQLAHRYLNADPAITAAAIPTFNLIFSSSADARPELEFFYTRLAASAPEIIGGKLPDDGFYHSDELGAAR